MQILTYTRTIEDRNLLLLLKIFEKSKWEMNCSFKQPAKIMNEEDGRNEFECNERSRSKENQE